VKDFGQTDTSLLTNPQYWIKFIPPTDGSAVGSTIILWVMVSKLVGIMHNNGVIEDEENSSDYIALHVYNSKQEGAKI
jgi:hypothetical protein